MIRIVIADDQPISIAGVRWFISKELDIVLVGEARNCREVLEVCNAAKPDLLLLDLVMPSSLAKKIIYAIKPFLPTLKIIIFTTCEDERILSPLFGLGIKGYVCKNEEIPNLICAIRTVAEGKTWFRHPSMVQKVIDQSKDISPVNGKVSLTAQEFRVVSLLVMGLTDHEIGQKLGITMRTVRFHMANVKKKLLVRNRTHLVSRVVSLGIVTLER